MISNTTSDQYKGCSIASNMIGFGTSYILHTGYAGIATVTLFIIGTLLENYGIKYDTESYFQAYHAIR